MSATDDDVLGPPPGTDDQPPPQPGDGTSVHDLVVRDVLARKAVGLERYGTTLQAGNGRDGIVDAYQEAIDLACYLRQVLAERGAVVFPRAAAPVVNAHDVLEIAERMLGAARMVGAERWVYGVRGREVGAVCAWVRARAGAAEKQVVDESLDGVPTGHSSGELTIREAAECLYDALIAAPRSRLIFGIRCRDLVRLCEWVITASSSATP